MKNSIKNRKMRKILSTGLVGFFLVLFAASCELDYENTGAINPDNVWSDPVMIKAYVTDIHGGLMPGWPVNGDASDEASNAPGGMSQYLRGIIDGQGNGSAGQFSYTYIDKINFFLNKLPAVTVLSQAEKDQLEGQALFWRAWDYWGKVQSVGGVPLILNVQNIDDKESLFVPRNKTSECINQMIADLDGAIAKLPATWTGVDYGKIDKCAAAALKGKILMWWASPLFNPTNDASRWQAAYTATKTAVDICVAAGKKLQPKYADIWQQERNNEVIMVNQFYFPDHAFYNGGVRPEPLTRDNSNQNQPYLPLITAYPKKDGTALAFDPAQAGTDVFDQNFLTNLYTQLDDRFYATVFCPGTIYPSKENVDGSLQGNKRYWSTWKNTAGFKESMAVLETALPVGNGSVAGFHTLKGVDQTIGKTTIYQAGLDWVEFRFAEVLMNYGECANETGRSAEAIDVLKQIRQRAGVTAVNGGITASNQTEIRNAYIKERFVEFALENKRWGDLRRLKRFDILNSYGSRSSFKIVIKDNNDVTNFDWTSDMKDAATRAKFKLVYIQSFDGDPALFKFNLDMNHWFYAININDINRNKKIEQNNEWGGTFDPLK